MFLVFAIHNFWMRRISCILLSCLPTINMHKNRFHTDFLDMWHFQYLNNNDNGLSFAPISKPQAYGTLLKAHLDGLKKRDKMAAKAAAVGKKYKTTKQSHSS